MLTSTHSVASPLQTLASAVLQRGLLTIALPLVVLFLAYLYVYQSSVNELTDKIRANQFYALQEADAVLKNRLLVAENDVRFMASNSLLQQFLSSNEEADHIAVEQLLADLMATRRSLFDQLRYIDENGQELLRINNNASSPVVVDHDQLQDKSKRYYFTNAINLGESLGYISPFDLNIENGVIERPLKPTLRLATRAKDRAGTLRGVLVINYLGLNLLNRLRSSGSVEGMDFWMVNQDGEWLAGPRADHEWGFMFPEREDRSSFASEFPSVWQALQADPNLPMPALSERGELISINIFRPNVDMIQEGFKFVTDPGMQWYLISHLDAKSYAQQRSELFYHLLGTFALISLLVIGLGSVAAVQWVQRSAALKTVVQREREFTALLESAPDPMVVTDRHGRIVMANNRVNEVFGISPESLIDQFVERLIPERFHLDHLQHRKAFMAAPEVRSMGEGMELFATHSDGHEFPVTVALSTYDSDNGLRVIAAVRDISELHERMEQQRDAERRLKLAADAGEVGIWDYDLDNDQLMWDHWMYQLYNVGPDNFKPSYEQWTQLVHPDDLERVANAFQVSIRSQQRFSERYRILKQDGSARWIEASGLPITDQQGNVSRIIGTNMDVTADIEARRHIEHTLSRLDASNHSLTLANKELEAFSYSVSHDLRAPLRAIDGFSQIVSMQYADKLDAQGQDMLARLRAGAKRMSDLIDEMLTLSRISRAEVKRHDFNISELVQNVVDGLRESFPEHSVDMQIQLDITANGDPKLVRIVLENLLGNAWKFTSQREQPQIEFGCIDDAQGERQYWVKDNGAGFDMEYKDKLFQAFQRLHSAQEFPGTGIGLATTARVIHKHLGDIWADSKPDEGATFYFTLPLPPVDDGEFFADLT